MKKVLTYFSILYCCSFNKSKAQSPVKNEAHIKIAEFSGEYNYNNNSVKFNWATSEEENNQYFIIERSEDMEHFTEICKVKAAGNSKSLNEYSCNDVRPMKGIAFYRLRYMNEAGESFNFEPLTINAVQKINDDASHIIPNPNDGLFRILVPTSEELVHIQIMNELAQPLKNLSIKNHEPNFYLSLDLRDELVKGNYYVLIDATHAEFIKKMEVVNKWEE
jgi:hypothetical protein